MLALCGMQRPEGSAVLAFTVWAFVPAMLAILYWQKCTLCRLNVHKAQLSSV